MTLPLDIDLGSIKLSGLDQFNVILGKNGSGKSTLLKQIDQSPPNVEIGRVRYISPERAGRLKYEAGVDQNIANDPNWIRESRRQNQANAFKQQSVVLFQRLELLFLRQLQDDHVKPGYVPRSFQDIFDKINTLLERVELRPSSGRDFELWVKGTQVLSDANSLSSGESEIVSLAIELLAFVYENRNEERALLLMDEPDVHLHPDLQDRFARFITRELHGTGVRVVLATHSTALVSAIAEHPSARLAFMTYGLTNIPFKAANTIVRQLLPIFGAHPLSNIFNQSPLLIVEGDDDRRIWEQACRSSLGNVKVYPCVAGDKDKMAAVEDEAVRIMKSVYDSPTAFSLRDRDDDASELKALGPLQRLKLHCRTAENLLLTDEALSIAGTDWSKLKANIDAFVDESKQHPYWSHMRDFQSSNYDRKNFDLKQIRNVLTGLMSNKPWEVLVGQAIAKAKSERQIDANSIQEYLGPNVSKALL